MTFKKFSGILKEFRPDISVCKLENNNVQILFPDGYSEMHAPKYFKILIIWA